LVRVKYDICAKIFFTCIFTFLPANNYYCFPDLWMVEQLIFNFTRFDAKAPDFDLVVYPADKFDISLWQPSGQVTGVVDGGVGDWGDGVLRGVMRG
jgi:hypothetical protein